ncbi:MAG: DUF4363 family protein [Clostridia bacterium]|nr:DUF4363 family protein [Clostridia bacterium]
MQSFITALIISVAVVMGSLLYTNRVDDIAAELLLETNKISECILNDEFINAEKAISAFEDCLEKNKVLLEATGNHEELLKIELSYKELRMFTLSGQKADALAQCASLDVLLNHMPSNYKIKAENIL